MWIRPKAKRWRRLGLVSSLLLVAALAGAEEASPEPAPVGLDALLRLPSEPTRPGAAVGPSVDRERWEDRFAAVRGELDRSRERLAESQARLEAMARNSESWQMAAPGAQHNPETSSVSFKLRGEIRRYREEVVQSERRLRELEVEASLAGIPADWRRPKHEDATPDS